MIFNPLPEKQQNVTLTLTGSAYDDSYIAIDGVQYHPPKSLTVPIGTEVYCCASHAFSGDGKIIVNGVTVASYCPAEYTYRAMRDATIVFETIMQPPMMLDAITITDT